MRPRLALCILILVGLVPAPPTSARVHRAEVGASVMQRVPATFDAVLENAERSGWPILWSNPPAFDPYYAASGATVASLGLDRGQGVAVSVTWAEFADAGEAAQFVADQTTYASSGVGAADFAAELDGVHVLTAYDYGAPPRQAQRALDLCAGARR